MLSRLIINEFYKTGRQFKCYVSSKGTGKLLLRAIILVLMLLFNGFPNLPVAHPYETKPYNYSNENLHIHKNIISKLDENNNLCIESLKPETCNSFKKIETNLNGFALIGIDSLSSLKNRSNTYGRALVSLDVNTISNGGIEYGSIIEVVVDKRPVVDFKQETTPSCINLGVDCLNENSLTGLNNGHESQFYYNRNDKNNKLQTSLETASFYLSSPYGEFFIGADMGAAHLFSISSIDLYDPRASSIAIDYTGLNSIRTTNNVTGKAKKIIYTSPRLLGDSIGAGFEFGVSYAPNSIACGIEYCEKKTRDSSVKRDSPDLKDIIELGVAIDRNFKNRVMFEAAMSYAYANNINMASSFDNLKTWNISSQITYNNFTFNSSYLRSNNGLKGGNYRARHGGALWENGRLGVSLSSGSSLDENINRKTSHSSVGISYKFNDYILSTGLQRAKRRQLTFNGPHTNKSIKLFIQGGYKF